jgi:8-amino-7-oxononanoate synthase
MTFQDDLRAELSQRESDGLRRTLRTLPHRVLDLASNDYLGLAKHPRVIEAAIEAAQQFGAGARASRLVSGNLSIHQQLESELARFKGCESALLFSSGYAANLAVISSLARVNDTILCDKRNHASLIDACRLAQTNGAIVRYFSTPEKLRLLLESSTRTADNRCLIVSDGVFSMDGDLCDLPQLFALCREFDAVLILDDAHGTGTLGTNGRGTIEHFELDKSEISLVEIGTLSKALGAQGGFVCGSQLLIDYLTNAARPFIYSTGLSPMLCGAASAALRVLESEPQLLTRLRDATTRLAFGLRQLGFKARAHPSPIISVQIGEAQHAVELSEKLRELGVWCPAIRPPTVPKGTSRLRVTASAALTDDDILRALNAFAQVRS